MQEHRFNYELSEEIYRACSHFLEFKECYTNVFYTSQHFIHKFLSGDWKVAYGFMSAIDDVMVRHCYILNENNEVIDPTPFCNKNYDGEIKEYATFYIFDDYGKYNDAIAENNLMPDLVQHLFKIERDLSTSWAKENQKILI